MSDFASWIKVNRFFLKEKGFARKAEYWAIWVYLLANAKKQYAEYLFGGQTHILKRGQLVCSNRKIADFFGITTSKTDRILRFFIDDGKIRKESNNKFSIITILDYDKYQDIEF